MREVPRAWVRRAVSWGWTSVQVAEVVAVCTGWGPAGWLGREFGVSPQRAAGHVKE